MSTAANTPGHTNVAGTHADLTIRDIFRHADGIEGMIAGTMIMTGTNSPDTVVTETGSLTG
jgi:hypothetical protein